VGREGGREGGKGCFILFVFVCVFGWGGILSLEEDFMKSSRKLMEAKKLEGMLEYCK